MIQLSNIEYSYPKSDFTISIDSISIDKKTKTAVIGPSGYGKTTFLNLIAGILVPDNGGVSVSEINVSKLNENERRNYRISNIGFVFQDFKLLEYLNVMDNILLPCRINSILEINSEIKEIFSELWEYINNQD